MKSLNCWKVPPLCSRSWLLLAYKGSLCSIPIPLPSSQYVTHLDFSRLSYVNLKLVGSCNGLVCLTSGKDLPGLPLIFTNTIILNVATKEYRIIQNPSAVLIEFDYFSNDIEYEEEAEVTVSYHFGFGYDSVNDDYKVLRLGVFLEQYETRFYSLKNDTWSRKRIYPMKTFPRILEWSGTYILHHVGGALHYLGGECPPFSISAVDLVTEKPRKVELPDFFTEREDLLDEIELTTIGGCLGFVTVSFDVWMMRDYMVKESWTKLYQIPNGELELYEDECYGLPQVSAISTDGDSIIFRSSHKKLLTYDRKKHRVVVYDHHFDYTNENFSSGVIVSPSLVSVKREGGKALGTNYQ